MRKEIIETGKTVDAAIDAACEKLGIERDQCEWEIIDLPKKTFLGLKVIPAKVRVSVEVPDVVVEQKAPVEEKIERPQPAQTAVKRPLEPKKPPQKREEEDRREPKSQPETAVERVLVQDGFTEKEKIVLDYIGGIVRDFGLQAQLLLYREESCMYIEIKGEGLGTIIGRRGENLDAIQYLSGLVANRIEGDYVRVTVDCGNYRLKRKDTLEALAKKLASQVLKTNVSKTLEPMNPFERRVIHATVSKIDGVTSSSIGEEPNRRVVITSPTARRSSSRGGYGSADSRKRPYNSGSGGKRGGRSDRPGGGRPDDRRRGGRTGPGRDRAPSTTVSTDPPKATPESAAIGNAPIGKLDLE